MATKSKLLVRSHAVRESTSPPRESIHNIHNLKSAIDNQQPQNQSSPTNGGGVSHEGGGADLVVKQDESKQQSQSQYQQVQHQSVENHYHHQQLTVNTSHDGEAGNEEDGAHEAIIEGGYPDHHSNEGVGSDESPTAMGKRVAAAKINGQKKLEQQGSSQSSQNGGQKTKFKTMGSSSSMEGVSSGFISRGEFGSWI